MSSLKISNYYQVALLDSNSPILTYSSHSPLKIGEIAECTLVGKKHKAVVIEEVKKPEFECKPLRAIGESFSENQIKLACFIAQYYCTSLGKSFALFVPKSLSAFLDTPPDLKPSIPLSAIQSKVFFQIKSQSFSLLFGQTGSGKSEVYIHLFLEKISQGKQCLFLMPEIALTPQMQKRLEVVFGSYMGVWHSKMGAKKKKVLEGLQKGEIWLIIGTRSALFLPFSNLGLIVVDEEHDDSYKSQHSVKYNARDLAIYMGKSLAIPILLGSATPSPTSYFLAKKQNAIYTLPKHFDSKNALILLDEPSELSESIFSHIHTTLKKGKQVIVFLPTRANFKSVICESCGYGIECPFCSVAMSLHLKEKRMQCHYCGYAQEIVQICPKCGGTSLFSKRIGTAQVADELRRRFLEYKIEIFDRDHIKTQKELEKTLGKFQKGEIDILVGTQMLSKGHDYHNVALVVIMGLDYVLRSGDYRARERAQSLFFQIKGRGGRKDDGNVILQSLNLDFFSYEKYEDFLEDELKFREELYPPFVRLATLTFSHKDERRAEMNMQKVMQKALNNPYGVSVIGGGSAGVAKIKTQYRYMILLKCKSASALLKCVRELSSYEKCEIDIDPLNIV